MSKLGSEYTRTDSWMVKAPFSTEANKGYRPASLGNVDQEWDVISKVGYRETLLATTKSYEAAKAALEARKLLERSMPGCYPGLFIRQAR